MAAGADDRPADARTAPTETSMRTATPSRTIRGDYGGGLTSPPSLVRDRASSPEDGASPQVAAPEPADGGPDRPRARPRPSARPTGARPNAVTAPKETAPGLQPLL